MCFMLLESFKVSADDCRLVDRVRTFCVLCVQTSQTCPVLLQLFFVLFLSDLVLLHTSWVLLHTHKLWLMCQTLKASCCLQGLMWARISWNGSSFSSLSPGVFTWGRVTWRRAVPCFKEKQWRFLKVTWADDVNLYLKNREHDLHPITWCVSGDDRLVKG